MTYKRKFVYREDARHNVKAEVAGERLAEIRERDGGILTPAAVVDDARPEDSPLHPEFEWDDPFAAEQFRRDQASRLIRDIRVISEPVGDEEPVPQRLHVAIGTKTGTSAYVSVEQAMNDDEIRQRVLRMALSQLKGLRARYAELKELANVFQEIDRLQLS